MPTLDKFQATDIETLKGRPYTIIGHEQGLGKSVIGSMLASAGTIIVCPSHARLGWERHLKVWRPDLRKVQVIRKRTDTLDDDTEIVVISYDLLQYVTLPAPYTLIIDEAQYCKNREAKRSQKVAELALHADHVYPTTGTPLPGYTRELWTILRMIRATTLSYHEFTAHYSAGKHVQRRIRVKNKTGGYSIRNVKTWDDSGSSNLDELRELVSGVMVRREKSELDLPERRFEVVPIIGTRQGAASGSEELRETLDKGWTVPKIAFDKLSKERAELGPKKVKVSVEYIKDVLEGTDKVVVFGWHKDVIDELVEELAEFNPVRITGSETLDQKQKAEDTFQNDPECRVIVGNIIAMGTHWTLTAACRAVFVELDWVPGNLKQAADRIHRRGQHLMALISFIVFDNTLEGAFIKKLVEKELVTDAVIRPTEVAA